jgi:GTPase SAR1 family protein
MIKLNRYGGLYILKVSIKMKDHDKLFTRDALKEGKTLSSENLGKVLLIVGPPSSGKTTLVLKLLEFIPNLFTINRKELLFKHIPNLISKAEQVFCNELLKEASELFEKPINNSLELYYLKPEELKEKYKREALAELKSKFKKIASSEKFDHFVLHGLFTEYYNELKEYIFSGRNVIIDEGIISSQASLDIFRNCCNNYSGIRTALLFNTPEDTLKKCVIRNNKFAELLEKFHGVENIKQTIERTTVESGNSSEIYRVPNSLIDDYIKYYDFKPDINEYDTVLGKISKQELETLYYQIILEHLKLIGLLNYKNYERTLEKGLKDRKKEIDKIMQNSELVYIVSKVKHDYYINTSDTMNISLLYDSNSLKDILLWLTSSIINAYEKTLLIESNYEHSKAEAIKHKDNEVTPQATIHIYKKLCQKYQTVLIENSLDIDFLINSLETAVKNALDGHKIIILLNLSRNNYAEFILEHSVDNILIAHYYDPQGTNLEKFDLSLITVAMLNIIINKLASTNSLNLKIIDLGLHKASFKDEVADEYHQERSVLGLLYIPELVNPSPADTFLKEWQIWSKCLGKILVINGVSSSGKTTLANHLKRFGFNKVSIDEAYDDIFINLLKKPFPHLFSPILSFIDFNDLKKILLQYNLNKEKYSILESKIVNQIGEYINQNREIILESFTQENIYRIIYEKTRKFILFGENVSIDIILSDNEQLSSFSSSFNYSLLSFSLLYTSLENNLSNCLQRNRTSVKNDLCDLRDMNTVILQYFKFYQILPYTDSFSYKFLDKVDKGKILQTLRSAQEQNKKLLCELSKPNTSSDYYLAQEFSIKKLIGEIASFQSEKIVILPTVRYDYLIKNTIERMSSEVSLASNYIEDNFILNKYIMEMLGDILE